MDCNNNNDNIGKTLYYIYRIERNPNPEVWGAQNIREDYPAHRVARALVRLQRAPLTG